MAEPSEITDLFVRLALHLRRNSTRSQPHLRGTRHLEEDLHGAEGEEAGLALALSSLNASLNFDGTSSSSFPASGVRVLDTALSLMCFKAPDLCNSSIECLANTILALLSSSISCKVSSFHASHVALQIGSSVSGTDCPKLIEVCLGVIENMECHGFGTLFYKLLFAVLKVATSACCHPTLLALPFVPEKLRCKTNVALSKLYSLVPEETEYAVNETPHRSLFWYLDPLLLKNDISLVLREMMERPFLCLRKELRERITWRHIIISLVTSPAMLREARSLLHSWFLVTALPCILELRIEIVSSVLDVLSRPTYWDLPLDLGLKLPFSPSYFLPKQRSLLAKLMGPISCASFMDVVHFVTESISHSQKQSDHLMRPSPCYDFRQMKVNSLTLDHKSTWAMLMDFPAWFYFASMVLFSESQCQGIFLPPFGNQADAAALTIDPKLSNAASRYLAWVLSPADKILYDSLVHCIAEASRSWTLKKWESDDQISQFLMDAHPMDMSCLQRKLEKTRNYNNISKDCSVHSLEIWLKVFQDCYTRCCTESSIRNESIKVQNDRIQPGLLFRRIPLGILIVGSVCSDDWGSELLLHYAATGEILKARDTKCIGNNHIKYKSIEHDGDGFIKSVQIDAEKAAIAGASLLFKFFDIIEDVLVSIFDSEGRQQDFICHLKSKVAPYLVKCINKLLMLPSEGRSTMFMDLMRRLDVWMRLGRQIYEGSEVLTVVFNELCSKISPSGHV